MEVREVKRKKKGCSPLAVTVLVSLFFSVFNLLLTYFGTYFVLEPKFRLIGNNSLSLDLEKLKANWFVLEDHASIAELHAA